MYENYQGKYIAVVNGAFVVLTSDDMDKIKARVEKFVINQPVDVVIYERRSMFKVVVTVNEVAGGMTRSNIDEVTINPGKTTENYQGKYIAVVNGAFVVSTSDDMDEIKARVEKFVINQPVDVVIYERRSMFKVVVTVNEVID